MGSMASQGSDRAARSGRRVAGKRHTDPNTAAKAAGYTDIDFLDKPLDGYPPGTELDLDGEKVDLSKVPDRFK